MNGLRVFRSVAASRLRMRQWLLSPVFGGQGSSQDTTRKVKALRASTRLFSVMDDRPAGAGRGQSDWCSPDAADEALGPSQGAGTGSMPCAAGLAGQLRESGTLRYLPELGKGLLLELPHTLTTEAEDVTNCLETLRLVRVQTVAQPHNQGLAFGEVAEAGAHATAYLLCRHEHIGLRCLGILQDILERRAVVRDGMLQLGYRLDRDQELFDGFRRPAQGCTEFLGTRHVAMALPQLGRCSTQLTLTLNHVTRQPDCTVLLAQSTADGLANPPVGIGVKFHPATRLKLVYCPHQPQIPFLDQVEHRQATVAKAQRYMNDQPEIGLHHMGFGRVQGSLGPRPGPIGRMQGWILRLRPPSGL